MLVPEKREVKKGTHISRQRKAAAANILVFKLECSDMTPARTGITNPISRSVSSVVNAIHLEPCRAVSDSQRREVRFSCCAHYSSIKRADPLQGLVSASSPPIV